MISGSGCAGARSRWRIDRRPFADRVPLAVVIVGLVVSGNEGQHVASEVPVYPPAVVERSGPAIRAALLAHAPERCRQFEAELRSALAAAAHSLDLSGPQAVLARWQAVAMMAANPLSDDERKQIEHAKAGDLRGLLSWDQGDNGSWVRR